MNRATTEELFLKGEYGQVCRRHVDAPRAASSPGEVPWVVAALVFLGRVEEARLFLGTHGIRLSTSEAISAAFFLTVGLARSSRYAEARALATQSLRDLRGLERAETEPSGVSIARFFAWQAVSFLRQMGCRYALALVSSQRAFAAAFLWGHPFARVLAADHRGHMLVRVGQVSEGLGLIARAQELAAQCGFAGIAQACGVSRLNYEAQHGRSPEADLGRLLSHRDGLSLEDCYSRASANVELARQYLLRGLGVQARICLDEAEPFLESHGQRRQKCSLWQRRANIEFWQGRFEEALACLQRAEWVLDPEWDLQFLLEVLGLRMRCLQELGRRVPSELGFRVARLTSRTGSRVAERILLRHKGGGPGASTDDDPLGLLLDRVEQEFRFGTTRLSAQRVIEDVLRSGFLLFLPRVLGFRPGARAVVLDVVPGGVLVVDGANLHFEPQGASPQIRALLLTLAREPAGRRELVERIWGYRYAPERHDSIIYALVRRTRRVLGNCGLWIRVKEKKYTLPSDVVVRVHEPGMERASAGGGDSEKVAEGGWPPLAWERAPPPRALPPAQPFTHRQILLLEWLGDRRFVSIQEIARALGVSKATANRDVVPLLNAGVIASFGKARAVRYELAREGGGSGHRTESRRHDQACDKSSG